MRTFTKPVMRFVGIAISILVRQLVSGIQAGTSTNFLSRPQFLGVKPDR
jgi:hypothetical protein